MNIDSKNTKKISKETNEDKRPVNRNRRKMRILVVDDERGTLNALSVALTSFGYPIKTVTSGRKALNIVQAAMDGEDRIGLLLTDLRMPGMNGIELIHSARAIDPAIMIILMTAYGENEIRKETLKLENCEYIEKPFKPEALLEKIKRLEKKQHNTNQQKTDLYEFRLYIVGQTQKSLEAIQALESLMEERFKGLYSFAVIDLLENPEAAERDHVIASPTLLKANPPPARRVIGYLINAEKVMAGLGLI